MVHTEHSKCFSRTLQHHLCPFSMSFHDNLTEYIDGSTSLDEAVSRSKMIHDPEDRLMQSVITAVQKLIMDD